jgi:branched-chain amino acid transport system ATP-binding protein
MSSEGKVLEVRAVHASYGPIKAVRGVSLDVRPGESVAVIGANGAGKTTLLRAISGMIPQVTGDVLFAGSQVRGHRSHALARAGLLHVPEGRGTLPSLSVAENLRLAWEVRKAEVPFAQALQRACEVFPRLGERLAQRAGTLSGGEQQMLALARAIMNPPRLLLVDEPSLGLSPLMVFEAYRALRRFQDEGMAILLVEQNMQQALRFAHRAYVLKQGELVAEGASEQLLAEPGMLEHYLGSATVH